MANSLGLTEFEILSVFEDADGRSIMYEVQRNNLPRICPKCGIISSFYKHTSEERIVEDIPAHGKLVYLKIKTGRYKCRDCGATFQEEFECIDGRERITSRFRQFLKGECLNYTFTDIANKYSLSVNTIRRIFEEYVADNEKYLVYKAPEVLGIDEAHLNKIMRFVVTDTKNNKLLDIFPDRETSHVINFLRKIEDCENIKVVTMDMYSPYKLAVSKALPKAKIVVDKYHVVQLANRKMDEVRKSVREKLDARGRKSLLYIAKLMKTNYEDLSERSLGTLQEAFNQYPLLETAFFLKEGVRDIYNAKTRREAMYRFVDWFHSVPKDCKPFQAAKTTFEEWIKEILNYYDYPFTNAYTESVNNKIKKLDKDARSLSFDQLRYKALFSTKATKLPKFHYKDADYKPSNDFTSTLYGTNYSIPQTVLSEGFSVDIDALLELL
jgi:transposase